MKKVKFNLKNWIYFLFLDLTLDILDLKKKPRP